MDVQDIQDKADDKDDADVAVNGNLSQDCSSLNKDFEK